jgi:hypothetical protein
MNKHGMDKSDSITLFSSRLFRRFLSDFTFHNEYFHQISGNVFLKKVIPRECRFGKGGRRRVTSAVLRELRSPDGQTGGCNHCRGECRGYTGRAAQEKKNRGGKEIFAIEGMARERDVHSQENGGGAIALAHRADGGCLRLDATVDNAAGAKG